MPTLSKELLAQNPDHEQGNRRCLCPRCREIKRAAGERYRRRTGARPQSEYFSELKSNRKHGRASYNRGCRCEKCMDATRTYSRTRRDYGNVPTIHERAWETFGISRAPGMGRSRCKCGCGQWVNTAHVTVVALSHQGYSLHEIAARLGAPYNTVCWIHNQAQKRAWPWYRRGHQRQNTPVQPLKKRYAVSKRTQLSVLIEQQDAELLYPDRIGYKHMGRVQAASRSLDAVLPGTESFTLGDTIAAGGIDQTFDEMEVQQAGTLIEQLERLGLSLDTVTELVEDDAALAAEFAKALTSGRLSPEAISMLQQYDRKAEAA